MNIDIKDKVAIVTKAAGGAGFGVAASFASLGAKVVLADVNEHLLKRATNVLKEQGYDVTCINCDVSKEDDVKNLVNKTVEIYGSLDIAYNNALIKPLTPLNLIDIKREYIEKVMSVNFFGFWNCMKYEIMQMKKQKSGRIYNSISDGDLPGNVGLSVFKSAQQAVIALTSCAIEEYKNENIKLFVVKSLPNGVYKDAYVNNNSNNENQNLSSL